MINIKLDVFVRDIALFYFPRKADERYVRVIVEQAWLDGTKNDPVIQRMGWTRQWARGSFSSRAGDFVRNHYRKHGSYPVGWHKISSHPDARYTYFAFNEDTRKH